MLHEAVTVGSCATYGNGVRHAEILDTDGNSLSLAQAPAQLSDLPAATRAHDAARTKIANWQGRAERRF